MNPAQLLQQQLAELHALTRVQRILRLSLRAFWLGMGGVMLGWGLNALWGWLPNPLTWLSIGIFLAAWPVLALARTLSPRVEWVWRLDRRLNLYEQVSTAWDVAQKDAAGPVSEGLLRDVNMLLPKLRERIFKRGWFLEADLISALVVILLGIMVLGLYLLQSYSGLLDETPVEIVAPTMPPAIPPFELPQEAPQPNTGAQPAPNNDEQGGQTEGGEPLDGQPGENPAGAQPPDSGALEDVLRQLGSKLSSQAGTYDLGQALEEMDLDGAAEALDSLAQDLGDLSLESRDNLAQALQDAAGQMQQPGEQPPGQQVLAEDMRSAVGALQQQEDDAVEQALDEIAGDLRALAQEMGSSQTAGSGAGTGGDGGSAEESLARLQGENGEMELPLADSSESMLFTPGSSDLDGDGVVDGSTLSPGLPGDDVIQSPLLPGSLLWKWRNVVSQFFQR